MITVQGKFGMPSFHQAANYPVPKCIFEYIIFYIAQKWPDNTASLEGHVQYVCTARCGGHASSPQCWQYHTSHFSTFYSHDSLLAVHEIWQWSHILQRPGKGQELLPSHLYVLQNQCLLLESRFWKRFTPSSMPIAPFKFNGAIIEPKWRGLDS